MKYKINVIDFDCTLIAYDSFRKLILQEIKHVNILIIFLTFFRKIKLISSTNYKKIIYICLKNKFNKKYFVDYARILNSHIDNNIISLVNTKTDPDTVNVLLSASPDLYVKEIIKILKWHGSGSHFNKEGEFVHMYKEEKIKWLDKKYNKNNYEYNFAISDSVNDQKLLSLFKESVLLTSH